MILDGTLNRSMYIIDKIYNMKLSDSILEVKSPGQSLFFNNCYDNMVNTE